jgi:hypothetical protein
LTDLQTLQFDGIDSRHIGPPYVPSLHVNCVCIMLCQYHEVNNVDNE